MTRLLVSVRDLEEARTAIAAGVDILDLKEPRHGPLGTPPLDVIRAIVRVCPEGLPRSLACGELHAWDGAPHQALLTSPIDYAKIGLSRLASSPWPRRWLDWRDSLPATTTAVLVAYADHRWAESPDVFALASFARNAGCPIFLIDTYNKSRGRLTDLLSPTQLEHLANELHRHSQALALAGRLNARQFRALHAIQPSILAVRSLACSGGREGRISHARISALTRILRQCEPRHPVGPAPPPPLGSAANPNVKRVDLGSRSTARTGQGKPSCRFPSSDDR